MVLVGNQLFCVLSARGYAGDHLLYFSLINNAYGDITLQFVPILHLLHWSNIMRIINNQMCVSSAEALMMPLMGSTMMGGQY